MRESQFASDNTKARYGIQPPLGVGKAEKQKVRDRIYTKKGRKKKKYKKAI